MVKNTSGEEPVCQCRRCKRHRFDPWVGKSPRERHGNLLQYSCLENPMTEEPGRVQSMGSQTVLCMFVCIPSNKH